MNSQYIKKCAQEMLTQAESGHHIGQAALAKCILESNLPHQELGHAIAALDHYRILAAWEAYTDQRAAQEALSRS